LLIISLNHWSTGVSQAADQTHIMQLIFAAAMTFAKCVRIPVKMLSRIRTVGLKLT